MPVEIKGECRIDAGKGDEHIVPALGYGEVLHIAADGVLPRRNLPRHNALVPVPRIRRIRIVRDAMPLHLDVRGHMDRLPVMAVVVRRRKVLWDGIDVPCIGELPDTIKRAFKGRYAARELCLIAIKTMIAVGGQAVLREISRVAQFTEIKAHRNLHLQRKRPQTTASHPVTDSSHATCLRVPRQCARAPPPSASPLRGR